MSYERDGWTYATFERADSLQVQIRTAACPTCGAPPGAYCKTRTGRPALTNDSHFARQRAATGERQPTAADRFWPRVDKTDTCWLWTAGDNGAGYGKFYFNGTMVLAHRWSYEHARGPIPNDLFLDHLCRNPPCVNPDHLEPVTPQENTKRGKASFDFSGLCLAGLHDMTNEANIYVRRGRKRGCKPCSQAARRARHYQETQKAAG